ncbi:glucosamine-6-phosphate deaminase [Weissella confusa]|uniref:Glucosamine-6-phosphate deaminase n=1 Tax=Weissella fermenti TaxID=2987699 RepID=A0ABT6D0G0_9LACO|nr:MULTISPECIES: glucosamine-6-phosphate deaminase [Weissella]MBJ7688606.1 glucosamine-6-phosphate deaminase [Weissella confusa]MCW0926392.1 glucosamine-6-phosphate deaminase [Weissella sp. LMG 11983]MDF9298811.1 glucosamine-6-phosphate deaminase [Weissella sp. BK2]
MKILQVKDQQAGGRAGYEVFAEAVKNGAQVFGLATGSTPISIYDELKASDLDFSDKISINLDEYKGLPGTHEQSYRYFMNEHLFNAKPFKESYVPDGMADTETETKRYEGIIDANPIDLQILGLGQNGHIGFNEPGTPFDSLTHEVTLTESTIEANARFFENENEVPRYAYSMGIGSIMKAKQILLVAYGAAKADAVAAMIEGPVTEEMPASILQKHANVTVIIDEAAGAKLTNREEIVPFV